MTIDVLVWHVYKTSNRPVETRLDQQAILNWLRQVNCLVKAMDEIWLEG